MRLATKTGGNLIWISAALLWLLAAAPAARADVFEWADPKDGNFSDSGAWTRLSGVGPPPPGIGDEARFNEAGTYTVSFPDDEESNFVNLSAGDVTLRSTGTDRTYRVSGPASISVLLDGGALSLGAANDPLTMLVGNQLIVRDGAQLNINHGSFVDARTIALSPGGNGTIVVDGPGSRLAESGSGAMHIGASGTGALKFQNRAVGDLGDIVQLAHSGAAGARGILDVLASADVSLQSLSVGAAGSSATASGEVEVDGLGSSLSLNSSTASLTIGNATGGPSGSVSVSNSAVLNSASLTNISNSGSLRVNAGTISPGVFNAHGLITLSSGAELQLLGGVINAAAGLDNSAGGTLDFQDGELNITGGVFAPNAGGAFSIDGASAAANPHLNLSGGATSTITGNLVVASARQAQFTVEGGAVFSAANATFGSLAGSAGLVTVSGAGSRIDLANSLFVGLGGTAELLVEQEGRVADSTGEIRSGSSGRVSGSGSLWTHSSTLSVQGELIVEEGGDVTSNNGAIHSGGGATITGAGSTWVTNDGINVGIFGEGALAIEAGGSVSSDFGALGTFPDTFGEVTVAGRDGQGSPSTWTISGPLVVGSNGTGALTIAEGGRVLSHDGSVAPGSVAMVNGAGSAWSSNGDLRVGGNNGASALLIEDGGQVDVAETFRIARDGAVTIDGGSVALDSFDITENGALHFISGTMTIRFGVEVGGNAFPTGLTLAPHQHIVTPAATTVAPLRTLRLDGGSLTTGDLVVNGALQFESGVLEILGAISGLSTFAVPAGGEFRAQGVHALQVLGAAGSTITAIDDLTLGNAADSSGFYANGALAVGEHVVTLVDANDAVLDSAAQATLGAAGAPGALVAANGLTLDFGGNISGFGALDTPNDLTRPLINNGHIAGNSTAEPITLSGYVKGVGTLDNVAITGTLAPGFSPAAVICGSVLYNGVLEIEIGGTSAGSQYDQLNHLLGAGVASLGGVLDVQLINGFAPSAGDSFDIINAVGGIQGTFDSIQLPALAAGLLWDAHQLETDGLLAVISAPTFAADFDEDGDVDGDDLQQWQGDFGINALSDADDDGDSDGADFVAWQRQLGSGAPAASVSTAVPEPVSWALLSAAVVVAAARRRD